MSAIPLLCCPVHDDRFWTPDQVRASNVATEKHGTEPITHEPVYPAGKPDYAPPDGWDSVEGLGLIVAAIRDRPQGLLVSLRSEHAIAPGYWSVGIYDAHIAELYRDEQTAYLHAIEAEGLAALAEQLRSFYGGYRVSLMRALRAELNLAKPHEMGRIFGEVIALDAAWAARILSEGVAVHTPPDQADLMDIARFPITEHLTPATLEPLLGHEKRWIREAAIHALGAAKPDARDR